MKRYILLLLTAILALSAFADEADEPDNKCVIKSFVFVATVHEDNTWSVTEKVVASFLEPRHGIYQYIDSRYDDLLDNELYRYYIDVTDVFVPTFTVETEEKDGFHVIRIGEENRTVSGDVEYTINYKLHFNDDRYAKADFLYASVLGAQWRNEIKDFQFGLQFDKKLPADFEKSFKIHSGELGKKGNSLNVAYDIDWEKNRIYGRAQNISHHNAITLRAELPQGFWRVDNSKITSLNKVSKLLFYVAIVLFVVVLSYLYQRRRRKPLTVIEYSAPGDISSAEVGYIMDNVADVSDLSSLIVWWASKGFLKIEEKEVKSGLLGTKKKEIVLHMLYDLPHDCPYYQRKFWKALFKGSRTECNINHDLSDRGKEVKEAIIALETHFSDNLKLGYLNKTALLLEVLYAICGSLSILYASRVTTYDSDCILVIAPWLVFICGYGYWGYKNSDKTLRDFLRENSFKRVLLLLSMAVMCCFTVFLANDLYNPNNISLPQFAMEGIIAGGWILVLLVRHLRIDTAFRMEKLSKLLGFREFIKTAELPMLKSMVDQNPEYFYEVLPFAMVFGLSDKWCEHFANIKIKDPDWYVADGASTLTGRTALSAGLGTNLSSSLGNLVSSGLLSSSLNVAITAASGGGGHSGGGGGGGGGGSW